MSHHILPKKDVFNKGGEEGWVREGGGRGGVEEEEKKEKLKGRVIWKAVCHYKWIDKNRIFSEKEVRSHLWTETFLLHI